MTAVLGIVLLGILLTGVLSRGPLGRKVQIDDYNVIDRQARIYPDYSSMVIPPNIAPLNFIVREDARYYFVRIFADKGRPIEVFSRSPDILIPSGPWRELLEANRGGQLSFDIFTSADKRAWTRFGTITNTIASEDIDGFMVYRRMHPTHTLTNGRVGIYQRNLASFDEQLVLDNRGSITNCVNCHSFCVNRPDKMLLGVRSDKRGAKTLLTADGQTSRITAKFGYTAWHPSGKLAVYSINNLPMFFHTARDEVRDTFDIDSAMAYFVVDSKTVKTSPEISRKDRVETWPAWSADGRYLYFCIAPKTWPITGEFPPPGYSEVKYDLVRISYDIEHDQWGTVETVLSARDTGLSIAMPRISPDGRWLVFCMSEYGYFPPWQRSSDLYIMDLEKAGQTGRYEYSRLDISSDQSEGWHGWSSNSRWLVFSSKKEHGAFTRCYFSYVDEAGRVNKPLVLPQKNPEFYEYCLEAFNTPEFVTGPIVSVGGLSRFIRSSDEISVYIPITTATPAAGTVSGAAHPWRE